jgi:catechol 2,3-dioxygenase-like lactoylglutathione lyase family enzyme
MDARIRYLAINAADPDRLAAFYRTYFGLLELGRSQHGDVSLTDGYYNLALLKIEPGGSQGLAHIGIAVDDVHELEARLEDHGAQADLQPEAGDLQHGQYRVSDPLGLPLSLSTASFGVSGAPSQGPRIRHVALSVEDNEAVLDYYGAVFGLREVSASHKMRDAGQRERFAGDGGTNLAILHHTNCTHDKRGINHFGFVVPDVDSLLSQLPPESLPDRRPGDRPMAEYRACDPEGNYFDISQTKGYEVDLDTWVRG